MKTMSALDLADFIKERQAHQVRSLRQAHGVELLLVVPESDAHAAVYKDYADDIGVPTGVAKHSAPKAKDVPEATALLWLCAGYNIEPRGKQVALVGLGAHEASVADALQKSGSKVIKLKPSDDTLPSRVLSSEIVVVEGGKAVLMADMLRPGTVVVELTPGGCHPDVYARTDLVMTKQQEGLLPLTAASAVDMLIQEANAHKH